MQLLDSAVNEESSLAKDTLYSCLLMAAKRRLPGEVVWGMAGSGIGLVQLSIECCCAHPQLTMPSQLWNHQNPEKSILS